MINLKVVVVVRMRRGEFLLKSVFPLSVLKRLYHPLRPVNWNNWDPQVPTIMPWHEKFLQFDWLGVVVFQLRTTYMKVENKDFLSETIMQAVLFACTCSSRIQIPLSLAGFVLGWSRIQLYHPSVLLFCYSIYVHRSTWLFASLVAWTSRGVMLSLSINHLIVTLGSGFVLVRFGVPVFICWVWKYKRKKITIWIDFNNSLC